MTQTGQYRQMMEQIVGAVPHLKALGIGFHASGPGWAELAMPYAPLLVAYADTGVVASGAIFTLMDTVAGFSVAMAARQFEAVVTIDLRCDYLRAATPGETIFGRAECYRLTRRIAFVRGVAHDGDPDNPVAHISGTFMRVAAQ